MKSNVIGLSITWNAGGELRPKHHSPRSTVFGCLDDEVEVAQSSSMVGHQSLGVVLSWCSTALDRPTAASLAGAVTKSSTPS
ncbi:hypothetical protein T265_02458 [Opisthorchis viverrini]|uniref:Uncharacterized protein n=1 Tax=Opisthorchis viverrini TaxID=6198 RepID=A0A074ZUY6_OPIVI|nr:hypothetical protein T265_02458 [Opisthorchis viverrini]KER31273.1 hypothetical protein T265_02458 [Opisthorchis viverrini]